MENLYIVVYKHSENDRWQEKANGAFSDRRLAENYAEILKAQRWAKFIAVVDGVIVPEETPAEVSARLGEF